MQDMALIVAQEVRRQLAASTNAGDRWMTYGEAAAYISRSPDGFQYICRHGRGPRAIGAGKSWRTRTSWIDAWLMSQAALVEKARLANA